MGFRWEKRECVDCGKVFIAKHARSVRCPDCRVIHNREQAKNWQRKKKESEPEKRPTKNPNICTKIKSCKYGNQTYGLKYCDYLAITGHKRPCPAGECTVYKRGTRSKKS